jgi:RNA polymerase sigma-B factor
MTALLSFPMSFHVGLEGRAFLWRSSSMTARSRSAAASEQLWPEFCAGRDAQLREELIEQYRPLAMAVMRRLQRHRDEDLEQVALLGLIKAVDRFDPDLHFSFTSFAVPTIAGEIKRYWRDQSRPVRCPRSLLNLHARVVAEQAELTSRLGREPTLAEVASALDVGLEEVVEALAVEDICHPRTLDGRVRFRGSQDEVTLEDCLGTDDSELERVEERVACKQVLDHLNPVLKKVIQLRYYGHMTQAQTAQRLGFSQMHVSRLERRGLNILREQLAVPHSAANR